MSVVEARPSFAPGPWEHVRAMGEDRGWDAIVAVGEYVVCNAAREDAPLIAVAPELYALIADQIRAMNNGPMSDMNYAGINWMRRAQAAIAKVVGS